jgi:four helix bundle protein
MGKVKELIVYQKAFHLAMDIFQLTKGFPQDEKYGLTSQIRRSSRSVCSNIAEGYRKRIYKAHFISKLTDADMENTETSVWIDFALSCGYIDNQVKSRLDQQTEEIGKLLHFMIDNPHKFM